MDLQENVDLRAHSTMRLGGRARWLATVTAEEQLPRLVELARSKNVPWVMIGHGSNIIWRDEGFNGLVIVNQLLGRKILDEDSEGVTVRLGAGEVWDRAVAWSVDKGWSGLEFLSLIPGLTGAAPVQNIGAYGAEIADTLTEVAVFDSYTDAFGTILANNCGFAYRTSRFKVADKRRFMITALTLCLSKVSPAPPFYESLQGYFSEQGITNFSPAIVRDGVIALRNRNLPDPAKIANNGSFFTNPIISQNQLQKLLRDYPAIKNWPDKDGYVKISAGWLLEKAGFKDFHDKQTGMATWGPQALVFINEHAKSTADLLAFRQKVTGKIQQLFGITLEQEPELLPQQVGSL